MSNSDDEALGTLRIKLKNTGLRNDLDTIANDRKQSLQRPAAATGTPDISAYSAVKGPESNNKSLELLRKHDKSEISDSTLSSMIELRNMKSENDLMRQEIDKLKSEINEAESKLDNISRISQQRDDSALPSPQPNGIPSNKREMREIGSIGDDHLVGTNNDGDENDEEEENNESQENESFWHNLCWCCY